MSFPLPTVNLSQTDRASISTILTTQNEILSIVIAMQVALTAQGRAITALQASVTALAASNTAVEAACNQSQRNYS